MTPEALALCCIAVSNERSAIVLLNRCGSWKSAWPACFWVNKVHCCSPLFVKDQCYEQASAQEIDITLRFNRSESTLVERMISNLKIFLYVNSSGDPGIILRKWTETIEKSCFRGTGCQKSLSTEMVSARRGKAGMPRRRTNLKRKIFRTNQKNQKGKSCNTARSTKTQRDSKSHYIFPMPRLIVSEKSDYVTSWSWLL